MACSSRTQLRWGHDGGPASACRCEPASSLSQHCPHPGARTVVPLNHHHASAPVQPRPAPPRPSCPPPADPKLVELYCADPLNTGAAPLAATTNASLADVSADWPAQPQEHAQRCRPYRHVSRPRALCCPTAGRLVSLLRAAWPRLPGMAQLRTAPWLHARRPSSLAPLQLATFRRGRATRC